MSRTSRSGLRLDGDDWSLPVVWLGALSAARRRAEAEWLARLPTGHLVPLTLALLVSTQVLAQWGIAVIYTESHLFLLTGFAAGAVSPVLGGWFVTWFAAMDLLAHWSLSWNLVGRLISWLLLWLLVVEIPAATRATGPVLAARMRDWWGRFWGTVPSNDAVTAIWANGFVAAALVQLWCLAAPFLVRPVYTWGTALGQVDASGIAPLQSGAGRFVVASAALVCMGARTLREATDAPGTDAEAIPGRTGTAGFGMATVLEAGVIVLILAGLLQGLLEVVMLAVALLVGEPARRILLRIPRVQPRLARMPGAARVAVAAALTFLVGWPLMQLWYSGAVPDALAALHARVPSGLQGLVAALRRPYVPVVLIVALGSLLMRPSLDPSPPSPRPKGTRRPDPGAAGVAGMVVVLVAMALLPFAPTAAGHNCSPDNLQDCHGSARGAAAAAAGTGAAAGLTIEMIRRRRRRLREGDAAEDDQ